MPCATLHCIVHLVPPAVQKEKFPGVYAIRTAPAGSTVHYSLLDMALWSSIPYALWQLIYHFLITVRRRDQIAAGRPTSFTWLRKSFANTWIGKIVLSLPEQLQEPAFMLIQYTYALLTMLPVPLWFWNRWASAAFLLSVFTWSVYNGAVYYIDVFGVRFQKELESLRKDVVRWQTSPELAPRSPIIGSAGQVSTGAYGGSDGVENFNLGTSAMQDGQASGKSTGIEVSEKDLTRAAAANALKGGTESSLTADMDGLLKRSGGVDGVVNDSL